MLCSSLIGRMQPQSIVLSRQSHSHFGNTYTDPDVANPHRTEILDSCIVAACKQSNWFSSCYCSS